MWRKEGIAFDLKDTICSAKHGGGSVMAWDCMVASGTGSLIFIDDVTNDGSSRMNSEIYRNVWSADVQENASNLTGRRFTMQQNNDPKHTVNATKELIRGKMWKVFDWPSRSHDLNPMEHAFHLLKRRRKSETPQNKQLKMAAVKAWQSILTLVRPTGVFLDPRHTY